MLHPFFGNTSEQGEFVVCGLIPQDKFIGEYERLSGRVVDPKSLKYYQVMNAWKCAVMGLGSSIMAAKHGNNHQELLITWLGSAGGVHISHMISQIKEYESM